MLALPRGPPAAHIAVHPSLQRLSGWGRRLRALCGEGRSSHLQLVCERRRTMSSVAPWAKEKAATAEAAPTAAAPKAPESTVSVVELDGLVCSSWIEPICSAQHDPVHSSAGRVCSAHMCCQPRLSIFARSFSRSSSTVSRRCRHLSPASCWASMWLARSR